MNGSSLTPRNDPTHPNSDADIVLERSRVSPVWWLLLLALLVRLVYLLIVRPPFETVHWTLSTSLLRDGSFTVEGTPVTDFEPFYPLFLAAGRVLSGDRVLIVQALQVTAASFGAAFLFWLARALTGSQAVAAVAGLLYAVDPLLVRQGAGPSDLALATTLLIAFANGFVRGVTTVRMYWWDRCSAF